MAINIEINYLVITGVLIVLGLFLNKWEPPIKKQYIALILFASGMGLGHFMINNLAYGFLISGLVFYKDELVKEAKTVKESFDDIKNTNSKGE